MVCTFFGHRDTPRIAELILKEKIIYLIENTNVDKFYVGNNGNFDFMVRKTLESIKQKYTHIVYFIVLAYMPGKTITFDYSNTIYPDGLECVHRKYAIYKRNLWMISKADYVIGYVNKNIGGAAKFMDIAKRKKKNVINIADM